MKTQDFETLLIEAELHPWSAAKGHGVAFSVALHVPIEIASKYGAIRSMRHQCDWLVYQPAEFAVMTQEQAESQIAMCKKRLERAAKTKTGEMR